MTTSHTIIRVRGDRELSARVQQELFRRGARWPGNRTQDVLYAGCRNYPDNCCLSFDTPNTLAYCSEDYFRRSHPHDRIWDAATEWDELMAHLGPVAAAAPLVAEGYRMLEVGEILQAGDQFRVDPGRELWVSAIPGGPIANDGRFRRPIALTPVYWMLELNEEIRVGDEVRSSLEHIDWGPTDAEGLTMDTEDLGLFRRRIEAAGPPNMTRLKALVGATVFALIESNPQHPQLAGWIRQKANVILPPEANTTEAICEFVCSAVPIPPPPSPTRAAPAAAQPAAEVPTDVLRIGVTYSYTESGRCHYTQSRSGRRNYSVTFEQIAEWSAESSDRDELEEKIKNYLVEEAGDNPPETAGDDIEYSDFDVAGLDDDEYEVDYNTAIMLNTYLDAHPEIDPDLRDEEAAA